MFDKSCVRSLNAKKLQQNRGRNFWRSCDHFNNLLFNTYEYILENILINAMPL